MDNSFDSLQFYVKVVTGLLLLLNLALLMSIRYGIGWANQLAASLPEAERSLIWHKASRVLGGLIVVVIAVNGAAIFAHSQLRQSADAMIGEHGGSNIVLSHTAANH